MKKLIACVCLFISFLAYSQNETINPRYLHGFWKAKWIAHPTASGTQFGIYHFRKKITLTEKPASFVINVSADNFYRLFVNGMSVCFGPARSDLANWNFETIDIAPYLRSGENIIASTVWNFGEHRPYAQISFQTAFIVQGNSDKEQVLNTNNSWKVTQDVAYEPLPIDRAKLLTYIVVADGEKVDGNKYAWNFEQLNFDDSNWPQAQSLWYPAKSRTFGTDGNWQLVPRSIPLLEERKQNFSVERTGVWTGNNPMNGNAVTVPANTKYSVLLDQVTLTNAYPHLVVSKGKDSQIRLSYAEAMVDSKRQKGNRDSIAGKELIGFSDIFIPDGGDKRDYAPLHFRTFRYLQIDIETKSEPLQLENLYSIFTGYPFKETASFSSNDASLKKIWDIGWRTARLCATDTYFDCPYYEQLQYVGDTRIQAYISLYVSGDDRLMKKAIDDISHSSIPDGLTQSRYPSRDLQVIPTFSLWWVCMVHDFWMHRKDDAFVKSHLDRIENVLGWYKNKMAPNGMLGSLSWWQFVDWSWSGKDSIETGGVPPGTSKGGASIISLQFAYTLQRAAQLMERYGRKDKAVEYAALAKSITAKTYALCWDAGKGMLADTYNKKEFSQHANIMAVLTDAIPLSMQKTVIEKIIADKNITQCTYYFKFYLFEALKKVKLGDQFIDLLKPWYDMIDRGLTTFAEQGDPTRSDCHAWSASPDYQFLSLVCGVKPASPSFEKVLIEPYLGSLNKVEGKIPHPNGMITVFLAKDGNKISGEIELPEDITGSFRWNGKEVLLKNGKQNISL